MRKLIESTLVSLDGVIETPERWSPFDEEATQLATEDLGNYDAFVMGRVTYERLLANWAPVNGNPYLDRINAMPKYVASRTLTEVTWNATLLAPDIVGDIERLKAQPGKGLIKTAPAASTTRSCVPASSMSSGCGSCPSSSARANACSKASTPRRLSSRSPTPASSPTARRSSYFCPTKCRYDGLGQERQ